jgi:hypothetical protein
MSERSIPKQSSTQRGASTEEGDCGEDLQRAKLRLSTLHDDWVGTDLIGDIAAEETARGPGGLAVRLRADGNEPDDSEPDPSPPRPSSPDDKPPIRKGSTGRVPWLLQPCLCGPKHACKTRVLGRFEKNKMAPDTVTQVLHCCCAFLWGQGSVCVTDLFVVGFVSR